jgi:hypothetical protein
MLSSLNKGQAPSKFLDTLDLPTSLLHPKSIALIALRAPEKIWKGVVIRDIQKNT